MSIINAINFIFLRRLVFASLLLSSVLLIGTGDIAGDVIPVTPYKISHTDGYVSQQYSTGRVESNQDATLGFEIGGQLIELYVDIGDTVNAGDMLGQLNTDRLTAAYVEAQTALQLARRQYELADRTVKRVKNAMQYNAVSQQDLDEAESNAATAKASVDQYQATVDRLALDRSKATLIAVASGVITHRFRDPGTIVGPGEPVLRLQSSDDLSVRLLLSRQQVSAITVGQFVSLVTQDDQPVTARVNAIVSERDYASQLSTVILTIVIPPDISYETRIMPNDLLSWELSRYYAEPGIWIPTSALTETVGGTWGVYQVTNPDEPITQVRRVPVSILYTTLDQAYIRPTVPNNRIIVANGTHRLVPNQPVRVLKKD